MPPRGIYSEVTLPSQVTISKYTNLAPTAENAKLKRNTPKNPFQD
jgi:hypothetical protein